MSPPHYEFDKAYLVAANGSMGIGGCIQTRWKVLGLAYNWRKSRDKRPLGRNQDKSRCHRYATSTIIFYGSPQIHVLSGNTLICCLRYPWRYGLRRLMWGNTSSCPGPYLMAACSQFHVSCTLGWNFSCCYRICFFLVVFLLLRLRNGKNYYRYYSVFYWNYSNSNTLLYPTEFSDDLLII